MLLDIKSLGNFCEYNTLVASTPVKMIFFEILKVFSYRFEYSLYLTLMFENIALHCDHFGFKVSLLDFELSSYGCRMKMGIGVFFFSFFFFFFGFKDQLSNLEAVAAMSISKHVRYTYMIITICKYYA